MAKKDDPNKGKIERVDPKTGEVTYIDPETVEDAEIIPEGDPAAPNGETAEEFQERVEEHLATAEAAEAAGEPIEPAEGIAEPERVHAYDAGEFNPEFQKLEGQIRNFMLDRIRNNWKPWQQMTVQEQQDLVNAIEQQARDTIRGTVRALNDFEWEHCMVTLGQVTLKGGDKGIEAKITCANVDENRNFLGEHIDSQVMILSTDAETFFGARDRIKYDGRGSQMDLPLGGSVKDIEAGGFAAEEEALQAPVLDGPEPDAFAPEPGEEDVEGEHSHDDHPADSEESQGEGAPGFVWPDDKQLGDRPVDDTIQPDTTPPEED